MVNEIILASKSRVRKKILEDNKIICRVEPSNVDEDSVKESLLKKNPKLSCVVGLTTEPERLVDIRKNRMSTLKETKNSNYTNIKKIEKEIDDAKKTFIKYKWPTIDVTRKSVEETAASIIKIHEIYKNNG